MALEAWLVKAKTAISNTLRTTTTTSSTTKMYSKRSHVVGVLAFEIAGLMSKFLHLWQSLSDKNVVRLRNEATSLEGVRKIVSNDDNFLLGLACAEVVENLRIVGKSVSRLCKRSNDPSLQCFDQLFEEFANSGRDSNRWEWSSKEMEVKLKKIDRYVTLTASLHKEIDELSDIEHGLKKLLQCSDVEQLIKEKKIIDLQQKVFWQKQEVKYLKETSLWSRNFDMVALLLARSLFTILARIKLVFGIGSTVSLPRSLSVSATVYPSDNSITSCKFVSGPLQMSASHCEKEVQIQKFFESNSKLLVPPPTTLGGVALSLHYANLIIVIEKMIRSPQLVGIDARDDLYGMLPTSIRMSLRARLKGIGFSASDPVLAGEWRDALGRILGWLSPLAHNMIKWQSERSFEQQSLTPKTNVLLLQTLYFANQTKTEAAITELLVGLNYIWRFEREMNAKALLEFSNFSGNINPHNSG
ncbi:hypothetical protein AQUCO_01300574v1 [Aquilegia coerulea]|uniref:DUF668 domain-containing protein n=1 Tax=Aquilegia coerulea TaxID=218851 RepID=A0A2G5E2F0_AQUCA|nr:hypothetical protein AQUCO_01300574v1 [Aquilegia coerulea]